MKFPAAIIFDCDGVLFESHQANLAYYNRIFARFNYPLIEDPRSAAAHICHTASSPVVLASLMRAEDVAAALDYAARIDYRDFIPLMIEATELKSSLERLARKMPLAVATNRGFSMLEVLAHFDLAGYFGAVVTCRDVERPKPAPDMLLLAAQRLGVAAKDCLFVGDSELDQQAASAAGIRFAAFGNGVEAEHRVNSHAELAAKILAARPVTDFSGAS